MFLHACLAIVSLTYDFLMCEFDHNTGLIKFNLSVCLFPNNAFTWRLVLIAGFFLHLDPFVFSEQSPSSSN